MDVEVFLKEIRKIQKEFPHKYKKADVNSALKGMFPFMAQIVEIEKEENRYPSAGELAQCSPFTTARVARLINQLEEKGFVKRIKDEEDARKTMVMPTDAGRKFVTDEYNELIKNCTIALNGITDDELNTLLKVIRKMKENLYKYKEE